MTRVTMDRIYFTIHAPCGHGWTGMRHSSDTRILLDRALDHIEHCRRCHTERGTDDART